MYREDITPGLGGPGTIRKGTEEPLKADVSRRSYKRRISCEALRVVRFLGSRILEGVVGGGCLPDQMPPVGHRLDAADRTTSVRKLQRPLR